jgi:hypothetical protein
MYYDLICWDGEDDPDGNIQHIAAAELTPEEVEEVLRNHEGGPDAYSDSTGNPIVFGTTSTGKRIAVIFIDDSTDDLVVIYPETAYPVPEYGD